MHLNYTRASKWLPFNRKLPTDSIAPKICTILQQPGLDAVKFIILHYESVF